MQRIKSIVGSMNVIVERMNDVVGSSNAIVGSNNENGDSKVNIISLSTAM